MSSASRPASVPVPPRRVVLLGASNLTRAISTIVETARLACGGPIDVMAALGHGRSYGIRSSILGRTLPGIVSCGLWQALDARPPAPVMALVTDIGNDLLYEQPVKRIVDWVEQCLERLSALNARTVMTLLPINNVHPSSRRRFELMRSLMFPQNHVSLETLVEQAHELNEQLRHLAAQRLVHIVQQQDLWYGFDPIHIRLRQWRSAWAHILQPWQENQRDPLLARASFWRWAYLRSLALEMRTLWGITQHRAQPAGRLKDGSTISFY